MKGFIKISILLLYLLYGYCTSIEAVEITVRSCEYNDVHEAVSSANVGDTIIVPEGTATWDEPLYVTKGITLRGAGIDQTIILNGCPVNNNDYIVIYSPTNPESDNMFRVTGFTFDANYDGGGIKLRNNSTEYLVQKVRVDNNKIINAEKSSHSSAVAGVCISGLIYGLIDHNIIQDCGGGAFRYAGREEYSWMYHESGKYPLIVGSDQYTYIESNLISHCYGLIAGGHGGRYVVRYNRIEHNTSYPVLDAHGNYESSGYSLNSHGTIGIEVYENIFLDSDVSTCRLMDLRGGIGIIYNNRISGELISKYTSGIVINEEDLSPYHNCKVTYPGYHPINNTYIWNNWRTDLNCSVPTHETNDDYANLIEEGRDYWFTPPPADFYIPYIYPHPMSINKPSGCVLDPQIADLSTHSVTLDWSTIDNAIEYQVFRDWVPVAVIPQTSYTDNNLEANEGYGYLIKAIGNNGKVLAVQGLLLSTPQEMMNNYPPVFEEMENKVIMEKENLSFQVNAIDPDGDLLTYSVQNLPQGAIFDPETKTFSWTPSTNQAGQNMNKTYRVIFIVSDGQNETRKTIIITVNDSAIHPKQLVGYYEFENNAHDSGEYAYHGVASNVESISGIEGLAYHFNGVNSVITVPDSTRQKIADIISLSLWFKPENIMDEKKAIISKGRNYQLGYENGSFYISTGSNEYITADTYENEEWYHLAALIDRINQCVKLYVSKSTDSKIQLAISEVFEDSIRISSEPLLIGAYSTEFAEGIIDEVMICRGVLTEKQFQTLFEQDKEKPLMVRNLLCIPEYNTAYLSWDNPAGQGEDWDRVHIVRKNGSDINNPDDGDRVYDYTGTCFVDGNLNDGEYYYAVYTYKETGYNPVYSEPQRVGPIKIPETYNKEYLTIEAGLENTQLNIGQNTRGDLYSLWNEDDLMIGRGPTGNETSIWLYSDIIGNGEQQIPAGSEIVSARLIFGVKDCSFEDVSIYSCGNRVNNNLHSINIYRIIDPDELGTPYYAEESGIRSGLDFYYRDHRPGMNIPWVIPEGDFSEKYRSVLDLFKNDESGEIEAIDIIKFNPAVFINKEINKIQFDITEAVQAWANGEENQGIYITTGQGWNNGEVLKIYGVSAEESDEVEEQEQCEQSVRPYLEIVYGNSGSSSDITGPDPVQDLKITQTQGPDTVSITLNWTNPDDIDLAGVKIVRSECIVPFNHMDADYTVFVSNENENNESYTDSGLTSGKTYYYALYAYDNEHNYSEKAWIKGTPGSPAAVQGLNAADYGSGTVYLSWTSIDEVLSYNIYRKNESAEEGDLEDIHLISSIKDGQTQFYDYVLAGEYTYWISALNDLGEGPLSEGKKISINEDSTEKPTTPIGFNGTGISGSEIHLYWIDSNDETGYPTGYHIERKEADDSWENGVVIAELGFDVNTYIDSGLLPDTGYMYRIKAVNMVGESDYVTTALIRTSDEPVAVKNISWEVISGSQIKVSWEDTSNEDAYIVELFGLTEDGKIDGEAIDTQSISANISYSYFVKLEPDSKYIVKVSSIKGSEKVSIESDIIRTSPDPKGGLF